MKKQTRNKHKAPHIDSQKHLQYNDAHRHIYIYNYILLLLILLLLVLLLLLYIYIHTYFAILVTLPPLRRATRLSCLRSPRRRWFSNWEVKLRQSPWAKTVRGSPWFHHKNIEKHRKTMVWIERTWGLNQVKPCSTSETCYFIIETTTMGI